MRDDPSLPVESLFGFDLPEDQWLLRMREVMAPAILTSLGSYELLEEVCRGGQGVVYRARLREMTAVGNLPRMASRADGNGNGRCESIAVKRLLGGDFASPSARRRFEREVEAISSLNHPGIISVIGLEVADGQPLLAMEWVDGQPVTRWARGSELDPPRSVEDVIDMMLAISDAVQHAHQRGVIHRDLKPSNILVDALDRPHVLDFGLVKLRGEGGEARRESLPLTLSEQFVGTTAYASPEQLRGGSDSVDTRSDVFSLGVILYEMLTGRRPFESDPAGSSRRDPAAALRTMESADPPRPSSLNADAGREIDPIVFCALAFDPAQRYQSLDAFAADLRRFREGEPVLARGPGRWYLLRKTLRRHRWAVAFFAVVFMLVIIGGTVATVLASSLAQARRQEHAARATAEEVNAFLQEMLATADPMGDRGPNTTARQMLDAAAQRIDATPSANPQVEATIRNTLGLAYHNLGLWPEAERHFDRALALRKQLYPFGHVELATSMNSLATLRYSQRRFDEAEQLSRSGLDMHRRLLGENSAETGEDLNNLGAILRAQGRLDEAMAMLQQALAIRTEFFPEDARARTETLTNLAGVLRAQERFAEAEPLLRDVLALRRAALGDKHPDVAQSIDNLAVIIGSQGRFKEAAHLMGQAQAIYRERLGPDHPDVATSLSNLAMMQYRGEELESAVHTLRECLRIREPTLPEDDARLMSNKMLLGLALTRLDRAGEAEPLLRGVYELQQRAGAWNEAASGPVVDALIRVYESLGRNEEADRFREVRRQHPKPS